MFRNLRFLMIADTGCADPLLLTVKRISLYIFQTGVGVLATELSYESEQHPLALNKVLDLMDQVRRVYAPYWYEGQAGHCPKSLQWMDESGAVLNESHPEKKYHSDFDRQEKHVGHVSKYLTPPVAGCWEYLISPLRAVPEEGEWSYSQIEDERIPTMAYLAVRDPTAITPHDWVRLAFLDGGGDSNESPYSPASLKTFEQDNCYDRFWAPPSPWQNTRYLCSGYAFLTVGSAQSEFFTGELFNHFRHHYFQMGLIAHMQQASLLVFLNRLHSAVANLQKHDERERDKFRSIARLLMRDFSDFASRFWSTGVTTQLQGKELFDLWLKQLGSVSLYEETLKQFQFVSSVLEGEEERTLLNKTTNLSQIAFYGLALSVGLIAVQTVIATMPFKTEDWHKWWYIPVAIYVVWTIWIFVVSKSSLVKRVLKK